MRVAILVVSIFGLLSGCSNHDEIIEDAEAALSENLKDPESLKTRAVRAMDRETDNGSITIVCGEFDAKNSYGGYTGYEPFAYIDRTGIGGDSDVYETSGLSDEEEVIGLALIHRLCEGDGTEA